MKKYIWLIWVIAIGVVLSTVTFMSLASLGRSARAYNHCDNTCFDRGYAIFRVKNDECICIADGKIGYRALISTQ